MEKKLKVRELCIDEESGVEAIALVESPAIEIDFLKFNKQTNYSFAVSDTEKRIVTGPAMVPDKMIYRIDEKTQEEFFVFFSAETIDKVSQKYLQLGKQESVNLEHETPVENVSLVESWIVKDAGCDKSKALGYDVPAGTWMVSMKVDNEDVWNEMVKTGKVKGFSIEGYFINKAIEQSAVPEIVDAVVDAVVDTEIEDILSEIKKLIESCDTTE